MKDAEVEAKEVKRERDETSHSKLSYERPAKRQKIEYQRYVNDLKHITLSIIIHKTEMFQLIVPTNKN